MGGQAGATVCILYRTCDSHNLNTNAQCDLTDTAGTRAWGRAVRQEYGPRQDIPNYVNLTNLEDPYRKLYPDPVIRAEEILTKKADLDPEYFAFAEDIAVLNIFFGKSTALGTQCINLFPAQFHIGRVRDQQKDDGV